MKNLPCWILCIVSLWGTLISATGQQSDKKESDNVVAQGKAFQKGGKMDEALRAYKQAARAGNVSGAFAAGELLYAQGQLKAGRERLLDLSEGLEYLFIAATNHQPQACARLAEALQNGILVQTNRVCAYAWLEVAAKFSPAFTTDLDRLVVQLEPAEILQAQKAGREYISGHWPVHLIRPLVQGDPRLQIQGVSVSGQETSIILNGDTVMVGESVNVLPVPKPAGKSGKKLAVRCQEIGADYALVTVAGEPNLKLLPIAPR